MSPHSFPTNGIVLPRDDPRPKYAGMPHQIQQHRETTIDETLMMQKRCRNCSSPSLHLDWAQGDRVCTDCGVVDEDHVRFDGPEWREFNNDDDLAKGLPSAARSGLVPTDETKYIGGLQPTTLSRHPYGGAYGPSSAAVAASESLVRRRLLRTGRRIDIAMERRHAERLEEARVARRVMAKRREEAQAQQRRRERADGVDGAAKKEGGAERATVAAPVSAYTVDEDLAHVGKEYDDLAEEEEEQRRRDAAALLSDKWSLDRAVLLHGTYDEQRQNPNPHGPPRDVESEREELGKRMDAAQHAAAGDVYRATRILLDAARRLELPERVINEATGLICRYAASRDGFRVRGVSNRTGSKKERSSASAEETERRQRDLNKSRQMGALGSALVYLTAKKFGYGRALKDVCASFQLDSCKSDGFIKPKHCSRAMTEVKAVFPEYVRSVSSSSLSSQHHRAGAHGTTTAVGAAVRHKGEEVLDLVDHSSRKLGLPPPAVAAIRALAVQCTREQVQLGLGSGTKPATLGASLTHLVCLAGERMQTLAGQALAPPSGDATTKKRKHIRAREIGRPCKKPRKDCKDAEEEKCEKDGKGGTAGQADALSMPEQTASLSNVDKPFDVMSHAPLEDEIMSKAEHKMLRVWDAWCDQATWTRPIGSIAESFSAPQAAVVDHYKKHLHHRRRELLEVLQGDDRIGVNAVGSEDDGNSQGTALLLSRIAAAAPLMA